MDSRNAVLKKIVRSLNRQAADFASDFTNEPIIWSGTRRTLVAHIVVLHEQGKIAAPDARQAVMQTVPRYVIVAKDGSHKAINPKSAWDNYSQQTRPRA